MRLFSGQKSFMNPTESAFSVELVYATRTEQRVLRIEVASGTSVGPVIENSGIFNIYPDLKRDLLSVGIFGQAVDYSHLVNPGERIEIYRPLQADPKEARRRRVKKTRNQRQANPPK